MHQLTFPLEHVLLQHVLLGLRFNELSWDHSYPEEEGDSHILWLEFDGEEDGTPVNKLLKIYSKQVRLYNYFKFKHYLMRSYPTNVYTFDNPALGGITTVECVVLIRVLFSGHIVPDLFHTSTISAVV